MCTMTNVFNAISELRECEEWAHRAIEREYIEADIQQRQADYEYIDDQIIDSVDRDVDYAVQVIYDNEPVIAHRIHHHFNS